MITVVGYGTALGTFDGSSYLHSLQVQEKVLAERERKRSKSEIFAERALEHPNLIVRSFSKAVRSIFLFFGMVVGGIIAAIIALASG